jgi:hypothetical protein
MKRKKRESFAKNAKNKKIGLIKNHRFVVAVYDGFPIWLLIFLRFSRPFRVTLAHEHPQATFSIGAGCDKEAAVP